MAALSLLDIDLDAFVEPIAHAKPLTWRRRLNKRRHKCWTKGEIEDFLEQKCGLSKSEKIPARYNTEHVGCYYYLGELYSKAGGPINVVHIDGHADLGFGDASYVYIMTEYLLDPPESRRAPPRGPRGLHSGNYLAYAIARRWIESLCFVHPVSYDNDLPPNYFPKGKVDGDLIQLVRTSKDGLRNIIYSSLNWEEIERITLSVEPPVPFNKKSLAEFGAGTCFDSAFLCRSPAYTTTRADELIAVMEQYMVFDESSDPRPYDNP